MTYLIHVGEKIDTVTLTKFDKLFTVTSTDDYLFNEKLTVTHETTFGPKELQTITNHEMKLTWSPASNIALYNDTTNIPKTLTTNLIISIEPN